MKISANLSNDHSFYFPGQKIFVIWKKGLKKYLCRSALDNLDLEYGTTSFECSILASVCFVNSDLK